MSQFSTGAIHTMDSGVYRLSPSEMMRADKSKLDGRRPGEKMLLYVNVPGVRCGIPAQGSRSR
jgi:hypothetical protein